MIKMTLNKYYKIGKKDVCPVCKQKTEMLMGIFSNGDRGNRKEYKCNNCSALISDTGKILSFQSFED